VDKNKLFGTLESNIKSQFLEKEVIEKRKQLLHQSRFALLGEMISMIAHQWRQPLNVIAMTSVGLKMKFLMDEIDLESKEIRKKLPEIITTQLDKIEERVQKLSSTIDDFAQFYKPSNEIDTVSLNEVVQIAVQGFQKIVEFEQITLDINYNSSKNVQIYKNEFIQICLNLLNNSYENIMEKKIEKPIIRISTSDYEDGVQIVISDNAGGIPQDIIEKIFDPYFSTKDAKNGTGLGLYMSKLVIQEHLHGEINVSNENGGAKFVIKLRDLS